VLLSVSKAQLVFAGGFPQPPLFKVTTEGGKQYFYVTSRPILKNNGSETGAVRTGEVVAVDLKEPPQELKILNLDNSEIPARATKEVRCTFVAVLKSAL
jgi:hypothetical protein